MNIIVLNTPPCGLNLFHLVHSMRRHPDMKRQQCRRQRSKALQAARALKYTSVGWVPQLPETHAWEAHFNVRGWSWRSRYVGRSYDEY